MDDAATTTSDYAADVDEAVDASSPARPARPVPLTVTEAALAQVLEILGAEEHPERLALRIAVTGTRGAEYAYDLAFDELADADDDDLIYSQGELQVIIPADSVDPLWGATLDLPSAEGQSGLVIRNPNRPDPLGGTMGVELSGTVEERVRQLLDQQINPALAAHGGFAGLVELIDGPDGPESDGAKVVITMGGGCQGCAVSAVTLRDGIQKAILEHIPEVVEVLDATDHAAGENPFYS